jgi:hypothetical protein
MGFYANQTCVLVQARPRCESATPADIPTLLLAFIKINVPADENATGTAQLPPASALQLSCGKFLFFI